MKPVLATVVAFVLAAAALPAPASAQASTSEEQFRVLVFSKTAGFRHSSIEVGVAAIQRLGRENGFGVDATEDAGAFTPGNLRRYGAVVFLNTTGTVLDGPQKVAFEQYIRAGGGFVGIHSAADSEYDWPFYARIIGAYFKNHPLQQNGDFIREDANHPATKHLQARFTVFDEFYSFRTNPRNATHVLLRIDEASYSPDPNTSNLPGGSPESGAMGDHPMSWCHAIDRGRSFYTALGHEAYLYGQDWYLKHILGGILSAAGRVAANCSIPGAVGSGEESSPSERASDAPLRLTRRCRRGRLLARVTGDTDDVRRINFKLDKRLARSDSTAPFARTIGRRKLSRTRARRLRAVVYAGAGRPAVLSRTLPRCGSRRR